MKHQPAYETKESSLNNNAPQLRLTDFFLQNKIPVDYHNSDILSRFISAEGRILPARRTGLTAKTQRKLTKAIKRARMIALLPYVSSES